MKNFLYILFQSNVYSFSRSRLLSLKLKLSTFLWQLINKYWIFHYFLFRLIYWDLSLFDLYFYKIFINYRFINNFISVGTKCQFILFLVVENLPSLVMPSHPCTKFSHGLRKAKLIRPISNRSNKKLWLPNVNALEIKQIKYKLKHKTIKQFWIIVLTVKLISKKFNNVVKQKL